MWYGTEEQSVKSVAVNTPYVLLDCQLSTWLLITVTFTGPQPIFRAVNDAVLESFEYQFYPF